MANSDFDPAAGDYKLRCQVLFFVGSLGFIARIHDTPTGVWLADFSRAETNLRAALLADGAVVDYERTFFLLISRVDAGEAHCTESLLPTQLRLRGNPDANILDAVFDGTVKQVALDMYDRYKKGTLEDHGELRIEVDPPG